MISYIKHYIKIFLLLFIEINPHIINNRPKSKKAIVYANSYRRNSDNFIESFSHDISIIKLTYRFKVSNFFSPSVKSSIRKSFRDINIFYFYSPGDYIENYFIKTHKVFFKQKKVYGIQHGLIGERKPVNINRILTNLKDLKFLRYISFEENFTQLLDSYSIKSSLHRLEYKFKKATLSNCTVNIFFDAFDKNNFCLDFIYLFNFLLKNKVKVASINNHPSSSVLKVFLLNFIFFLFIKKEKTDKYIFWDSKLRQKYLSRGEVYFFKKNVLYKLLFHEDLEKKLTHIIKNA